MRMPALFISHGTPMTAFEEADARYPSALRGYVSDFPKPKAIVVLSPQHLSSEESIEVTATPRNQLLYDFRGFPGELYQMEYSCPGSPELAGRIAQLVSASGFQAELGRRGLDHGVWVPLRAMFPSADIPVVQLSLPYPGRPEKTLLLGKALAELRDEGVLLIGSGSVVRNFEKLVWSGKHGPVAPWAVEFGQWVRDRLVAKDVGSLVHFEGEAPSAALAQPTPEHFFPLFFVLGASLAGDELDVVFEGIEYSSISMDCYALRGPGTRGTLN